ncbi:Protein CBG25731 [Caenorhabditis briggsae]|uniref:Protein CBG25731 n=2 Tax=Caenorhabditis briggsae TaxID=6238 RepID=B6IHQ2_CAEBR|nr:Protein CBG25731 [Caenorhabditis briggsae]ULU08376.1 hypothetical protein L3Y34_019508 [Caenorhabditis briggsae]CAR99432.1 Protein CBG25731 [Caenorhabditis briggsae]
MFLAVKVFLVCLAIQPMALTDSEEPLYKAFVTVAQTNQTIVYNNLKAYASATKNLFEYDAKLPGANFKNFYWMNPCYLDYYASNATYVVFWLKDRVVYCESVKKVYGSVELRFPAQYLMRVERAGIRCPNATST